MELVNGKSLEEVMHERSEKHEFMQASTSCKIVMQVLNALKYAHSKGIVHRDVKPSNILQTQDGCIKLTDFGIAKILHSENATTSEKDTVLTSNTVILGTPQYMSPEQIHGIELDGKTDVFSTGIVLYELLSGRLPFSNINSMSKTTKIVNILEKRLESPKAINRGIDTKLEGIILKALEKSPQNRYTAAEFLNDLEQYVEGKEFNIEGALTRRLLANRREFLTKGFAIAATVGVPTIISKTYVDYTQSIGETLDLIQEPSIDSMTRLKPLLAELENKLYQRVNWMYTQEILPNINAQSYEEHPNIYPFGSTNVPGKEGRFFYFAGESASAGFSIPQFKYAAAHFKKVFEESGQIESKKKYELFLSEFFRHSQGLYFVENDKDNLVIDRFYYPAQFLRDPSAFLAPDFKNRVSESNQILSKYARAVKFAIEKRYSGAKGVIQDANNSASETEPEAQKDWRISSMLCNAFRILDLRSEVIEQHTDLGNSIFSVDDYLELILTDGNSKLNWFLEEKSNKANVRNMNAKDYTSLMLGLANRLALFQNLVRTNHNSPLHNSNLEKNTMALSNNKIKLASNQTTRYEEAIFRMIDHYVSSTSSIGISRYYLEDNKKDNPINNIATMRFLDTLRIMSSLNTQKQNRIAELMFLTMKNLNSREHICEYNKNHPDKKNPFGFVKGASFNLTDLKGATYSETDYLYLKNIRAANLV
jgi:hypothetical protein